MAEFIVVGFEGQFKASEVLEKLQDTGGLDLNLKAPAVVERDENGQVQVRALNDQIVQSGVGGAIVGGLTGLLIGAVLVNPVTGLLAGSALGGLGGMAAGNLNEIGIDDGFTREVGRLLEPDCSAICFLFWDEMWDEAPGRGVEMIKAAGGKVIRTTLPAVTEEELNSRFGLN